MVDIVKVYDLPAFSHVMQSRDLVPLSEQTILMINTIARRVGAPTYQRTPVFKKRAHGVNNHQGRRPRQRQTITGADWAAMRNFKTTKLEKNEEGLEHDLDLIRSSLNKITATNYNSMKTSITEVLGKIIDSNPPEADLMKVGTSIFEIGSANKFWSKLYAELYRDLIATFPLMRSIYEKSLSAFLELFDEIRFVSAEEDYDEFCRINKENSKRRAMSSFFIHLMNNGVIHPNQMLELTLRLIEKFTTLMDEEGRRNEVEELAENLLILIGQGAASMEGGDRWPDVVRFVEMLLACDVRKHSSLSSKSIFKFMDIEDDIV
jgi:hypothetical protein